MHWWVWWAWADYSCQLPISYRWPLLLTLYIALYVNNGVQIITWKEMFLVSAEILLVLICFQNNSIKVHCWMERVTGKNQMWNESNWPALPASCMTEWLFKICCCCKTFFYHWQEKHQFVSFCHSNTFLWLISGQLTENKDITQRKHPNISQTIYRES